ncbi:hypothetical protein AB0J83_39775 [Actinoplanes sp. NPDC049596]|uniref:hypothetical protein n=1 Tax=unclassified Actinoplanes TaxID=2626549 RepID=UPI00344686E6
MGLTQDLTTRGRDDFAVESWGGLSLLLLAGAAYGILLLAPISPLGPLVAGLAFLGVSIWALESPSAYADLWPADVAKEGFDLSRPGYGLAAMLAVPLICTALSARRWARYEPPVLPLIGQIGRFRGAAPAPTTPAAVLETTVLPTSHPTGGSDPTTVLRLPSTAADPTIVVPPPHSSNDDPTVAFRPEEPTTASVSAPSDEPTAASPSDDEPTVVSPGGDEPTSVIGDTAPATATPAESGQVVKAPAAKPLRVDPVETTYASDERDLESTLARLIGPTPRPTGVVVTSDESATVTNAEPSPPAPAGQPAPTENGHTTKAPAASPIRVEPATTPSTSDERDLESTLSRLIAPTARPTSVVVSSDESTSVAAFGTSPTTSRSAAAPAPPSTPTDQPTPAAAQPQPEEPDQATSAQSAPSPAAQITAAPESAQASLPQPIAAADESERTSPAQPTTAADESEQTSPAQPTTAADESERTSPAQSTTAADESERTSPLQPIAAAGESEEPEYSLVTGKVEAPPSIRAVPPGLERTRSLDAPDPDKTRAIKLPGFESTRRVAVPSYEPPTTVLVKSTGISTPSAEATPPEETAPIALPNGSTPTTHADENPTSPPTAVDPDTTRSLTARDEDTTRSLDAPDPDTTRPLRAPDPDTARPLSAPNPDTTRSLSAPDPDRTRAISVDGLATVSTANGEHTANGTGTGDVGGDQTQVIRLQPRDPEQTWIVRPGSVEPPGERTEIIRLQPQSSPAEIPTDPQPASRMSIVDAEQPDISNDPTSRVIPPAPRGAEPEKREMTVMSMERPPDELPTQRRPSED